MTRIAFVFEVNWNGDGSTWVDESSNVRSFSWTRGRDYASQLTGKASSGRLTVSLNNPSGRYASFNASGALFGNLVPARRVRLRSTSPIASTVWAGFLDTINPEPREAKTYPTAILTAYGPLKYIAPRDASTAVFTSVATGTAVGYVLDDAAWPAGDRTIDTGQVVMNRWGADGDKALTHLRELEETELGFLCESADGKIVFEDCHHRLQGAHLVSQATFGDDGVNLSYKSVEQLDPWEDVYNEFAAEVQLYTVQSLATLWTLSGEIPTLNPGESRDFWAQYPTPDSPTQAAGVDAWTTPVASTDFTANSQSNGLGTDLTSLFTVSVSKFAKSMKITLTNTSTVVAYLTLLQARGTPVYANDPIKILSADATSQTKYGKRSYPLSGKYYPSTSRALSFCQYGISRYKDPHPILRLKFSAITDSAHANAALSLQVSDRITVIANKSTLPGTQLGISRDFNIETISIEADRYGRVDVTYDLSDALGNEGGYWVLGTSLLGQSTRLNV